MVVEQHLAVATAGRLRPAAVVAHRDDRRDAPRTLGTRGSKGHELRAGPAGEVVEVHSDEGAPVVGPDRGTVALARTLIEVPKVKQSGIARGHPSLTTATPCVFDDRRPCAGACIGL